MRALGFAVEVRDLRPLLTAAVVDDASGAPVLAGFFELTSTAEDLASQLHSLSKSLGTRLPELLPADRAVLRRADVPPRPVAATEPVKLRLLAEGAAVVAARDRLVDVRMAAGVELGRWYGSNKAALDDDALALVSDAQVLDRVGERKRLAQAVAAAIAGLSAPAL